MFKKFCNLKHNYPIFILTLICFLQISGLTQVQAQVSPNKWSAIQTEVWKTVEAYTNASHQRDLNKYLSFWHEDFLGWHYGDKQPTTKQRRTKGLKFFFNNTRSLKYNLEPLGILIIAEGKAAIVHYKLRNILENKTSGDKKPGISYWTDYLVKENNKWLLISDHGGGINSEKN